MKPRTVIYARSAEQSSPDAISRQRRLCEDVVAVEGLDLVGTFMDPEWDSVAPAPQRGAVLDLVLAGGVDVVLVASRDRWSRDPLDEQLLETLGATLKVAS